MATVQGELGTAALGDLLDVLIDPTLAGVPGWVQSQLGTGCSALCCLFQALESLQAWLLPLHRNTIPSLLRPVKLFPLHSQLTSCLLPRLCQLSRIGGFCLLLGAHHIEL